MGKTKPRWQNQRGHQILAPRVGLEPTTTRLTAAGSTIELSRNSVFRSSLLAPCVRELVYGKCARMQPRILTNFCTTVFLDDATADRRTRLVGKRHLRPPFGTMECVQAQVRSKGHGQTQRSKPGSSKNRVCRPRLHSARMAGTGCSPASHHGPSRPSRVPPPPRRPPFPTACRAGTRPQPQITCSRQDRHRCARRSRRAR